MTKLTAISEVPQCLLAMAMLLAGAAPAAADQLVLVCRSTVQRIQANGSAGVSDPYKVYVDTTAQTEHTDQGPPFSVSIDSQAIAGHYPNPSSPNISAYMHIDRTTGGYEFRQCVDSQCTAPPPSWILTDKGTCEKGEQRF